MPLYFSYGSCMSLTDLQRDVPDAKLVGPAILKDYNLAFTAYTAKRAGGVADIVPSLGHHVEGVVFDVPNFVGLDRREGHPTFYKRGTMNVQLINGDEQLVAVSTYEVVTKSDQDIIPSTHYMKIILDGATILSTSYQERLRNRFLGFGYNRNE